MTNSGYKDWDRVYREYPLEELPWELGKPRKILVDLVEGSSIKPCKTLDICCGAGTNTVYLAQRGFDVTAVDISKQAIKYAGQKARNAGVEIQFVLGSFVTLPFEDQRLDFVFDMGCFHHVLVEDREKFIQGVCQILKKGKGLYLLICFSDRNGPAWNHFTKEHLAQYFSRRFKFLSLKHFGSVEGDGYLRYFHSVLMQRLEKARI
jgi:ubiquinone/menaquinone biosynthesis C-methylase UbiE